MSTAPAIRRLRPDDLDAVVAFYNAAVRSGDGTLDTEEKSLADMTAWLERHQDRYAAVGAEVGARIAGYGALSPFAARGGYLASAEISIYLDPAQVGAGIGAAIGRWLTEHAERAGFSTVVALITSTNVPSRRLVSRLGYRHNGAMRCIGYKQGRLVDLEIYQRVFEDNLERYGGPPPAVEMPEVAR